MIFTIFIFLSGIFFLNGMQLLEKVKFELNWTVNIVGGLFVLKSGYDISRGVPDEMMVMVPSDSFPLLGALFIFIGSSFIFYGLPFLLRQFQKTAYIPGRKAKNPFQGSYNLFVGLFTLLAGTAFSMRIESKPMLILIVSIGAALLFSGIQQTTLKPSQRAVGVYYLCVAVGCFVPSIMVLAYEKSIF